MEVKITMQMLLDAKLQPEELGRKLEDILGRRYVSIVPWSKCFGEQGFIIKF